jgi:hypothetical protein
MKVVMSAEIDVEGDQAQRWCSEHLGPGDTVIAVVSASSHPAVA